MGEMLVPLPRYPNWQRGDEHGAKVVAFLLGAVSHYAAAPWRAHTHYDCEIKLFAWTASAGHGCAATVHL